MTAPLAGTALDIGGKIGRSFSIATVTPTLFLVLWNYFLVASDAWRDRPDLVALGVRLGNLSITTVAWLLFASLVLGLFLHPLQFATIQLLEGYWGSSSLAIGAMAARGMRYRTRRQKLGRSGEAHQQAINVAFFAHKKDAADLDDEEWDEAVDAYLDSEDADPVFRHVVARDAVEHRHKLYPEGRRMMPTRLGNALRRMEDSAGRQYGLDAVTVIPHLALIAPEAHAAYLDDSRRQLDTTARLCSVSLIATVLTVAAMITDGLWLLLALAPYGLAYLAYRATIAAAHRYASAVTKIIDINRSLLYQQLGMAKPTDSATERATNKDLMRLLRGKHVDVTYTPEVTEEQRPPGGAWLGTGLVARLFRRRGA
jgi:hypothetical protein